MKRLIQALTAIALLQALSAHASVISFAANLSGANEVPPNASPATGFILVTLDDVLNTLTVHEEFAGLIGGPAAGAHIHCCAPAGSNAPVVVNFAGKGFVFGTTSGTYDHVFNLLTDLSPAITLQAFISGLTAGNAYANIHNATFAGGEIRGQLVAVPEPAALALFGLGAMLLGFVRRRVS